jgi:hypothetical protein
MSLNWKNNVCRPSWITPCPTWCTVGFTLVSTNHLVSRLFEFKYVKESKLYFKIHLLSFKVSIIKVVSNISIYLQKFSRIFKSTCHFFLCKESILRLKEFKKKSPWGRLSASVSAGTHLLLVGLGGTVPHGAHHRGLIL